MGKHSRAIIFAAAALTLSAGKAAAHHGWGWTTGASIMLEGFVTAAKLGLPHGVVTLDVDGVTWTVEVGQPWRNRRAGLKDSDLAVGKELRVVGEPSADAGEKRIQATRIYIGPREHTLYPERR